MRDLVILFKKAKEKKLDKDMENFKILLQSIVQSDSKIEWDWDDGAGEEWANCWRKDIHFACMLSFRIGIVFAKNFELLNKETQKLLEQLYIVKVNGFDVEEWYMNLDEFRKYVPEMFCRSLEDDSKKMSLDDLYWATV